jgi:hypothetical protein
MMGDGIQPLPEGWAIHHVAWLSRWRPHRPLHSTFSASTTPVCQLRPCNRHWKWCRTAMERFVVITLFG